MTTKDLTTRAFAFFKHMQQLKKITRRGWLLRDIPNPESVAEHTFGVAILAIVYGRHFKLDIEKILTIALLHEVAEAVIGDITPYDGVSPQEKRQQEEKVATEILLEIDSSGELLALWHDYEYQRSPEGKLAKELDRVEMALQAYHYQQETGTDLTEFLLSAEHQIGNEDLLDLLKLLKHV